MNYYELHKPFIDLFGGYEDSKAIGAFGTGKGQWIKRPLTPNDVIDHLQGKGAGIGVPPLRPDNTVVFAAIDLDEPDFEAAREMQEWIPGPSFIERSRSGNAHVWCFFERPVEAWVSMGILREVCKAAGKEHVEVFPKNHDFSRVKLGNYVNAPYHGDTRKVFMWNEGEHKSPLRWHSMEMSSELFISDATERKNNPDEWHKRAKWLLISEPVIKEPSQDARKTLHICAEHIIGRALDGSQPIPEGHRSAIFFALSSQLRQFEGMTDEDALSLLKQVNDVSPDPLDGRELLRIFNNAGEFRSTRCDDPLVAPFTHPDCPIVRNN